MRRASPKESDSVGSARLRLQHGWPDRYICTYICTYILYVQTDARFSDISDLAARSPPISRRKPCVCETDVADALAMDKLIFYICLI